MFTLSLPLLGSLSVPMEALLADPTLILKKFPEVKRITQVVPGEYLVETNPMAITNIIKIPKRIVVAITTTEDSLVFNAPANKEAYPILDGWLEGQLVAAPGGVTMEMVLKLQSPSPVVANNAVAKNAVGILTTTLMSGFRLNIQNPTFFNDLPV